MTRVHSRHEAAAGGSADGAGSVKIGELHAFRCHPINAWRLEMFLSKTGKVPISCIIYHYVDEVRLTSSRMGKGKCIEAKNGQCTNTVHGSGSINVETGITLKT